MNFFYDSVEKKLNWTAGDAYEEKIGDKYGNKTINNNKWSVASIVNICKIIKEM